jgi:ubiquinone/menaquinone biosynthesis C-methylase UbiE
VGDACDLSFKSNEFDAVVFSFNGIDCLYPYEKRIQALSEFRRILKPGGFFVFSSHNNCIPRDFNGVIPFVNTIFRKKRSTYMIDREDSWGATKIFLTTPALQINELETSEFELMALVPKKKYLRNIMSFRLIGLIDFWPYYVARKRATF